MYTYPPARKSDTVDDFFGTKVVDPYRWLEDPDSEETKAFVSAQSALTESYLAAIPQRETIRQRLSELWDYTRYRGMREKNGRYFVWRNDGLQNQPVLMMRDKVHGEDQVAIDPNTLSDDGTSAITNWFINDDATKIAYVVTHGGSDWQEIRIRDLKSGQDFPETIKHVRFSYCAWLPDGSGFYYNGFDDPANHPPELQNYNCRIMLHTLGTPMSQDQLVYARPDAPELSFSPVLTDDKKYLWITPWFGAIAKNRFYVKRFDPKDPSGKTTDFVRIIDDQEAYYQPIGSDGDIFYVMTDWNAPKYRIMAVDVTDYDRENWREIIPEQEDSLTKVAMIDGKFILEYMHDAYSVMKTAGLDGEWLGEIPLPTIGSVIEMNGRVNGTELFLDFYSFLYPNTVFTYDTQTEKIIPVSPPELDFDVSQYVTRMISADSADGTRVPLFITHHKEIALDGSNPTILYGYGGYSVNLSPRFSVSRLQWLEMGGVYAQAVLRGGAEFGDDWHQAGMLDQKQNVFDDFIACAETLIAQGVTSKEKLAIQGGSNGGLLTGACMIQRPDLFGAILCHVPVLDMLRYHKFTAGRYWVPEYGDPSIKEHFDFLYAYSPLHNVKEGETHPPTMILTADKDDRVVPMHAHKFAATLQSADSGQNPLLLRFEFQAGHGFGKSTKKLIREAADFHAFLHENLGMKT